MTVLNVADRLPRQIPRDICTRDETVSKLAEIVDSQSTVHVRGTPASGKSILSLLLRDYYRRHGRTVFLLNTWEMLHNVDDPWMDFARLIRRYNPNVKKNSDIFAPTNVIIIDEAQATYKDNRFWNRIVKDIWGGVGYPIKLCLFCSYGSPSKGIPYDNKGTYTPARFSPNQRVSLTPSFAFDTPQIGLFYGKDEYEEVVTRFCSSQFVEKYTISGDARNYIFSLTNGHPGAVTSIMTYLFKVRTMNMRYRHLHHFDSYVSSMAGATVGMLDCFQPSDKEGRLDKQIGLLCLVQLTPVFRNTALRSNIELFPR